MSESFLQSGPGEEGRLQPPGVHALALDAGFCDAALVRLPYAEERRDGERFKTWADAGHAGEMRYLERCDEQGRLLRESVRVPFPWARSAIVCWSSYNSPQPRSTAEHAPGAGWIARYAWSSRVDAHGERRPSDYHKILKKRLEKLETLLRAHFGEASFEARGFVDTGPVLERALAQAAGLGWIGKNTCLIAPKFGSFGFLAVLLTSLPGTALEEARAFPPLSAKNAAKDGAPGNQQVSKLASQQVSKSASQRTSQAGAPSRVVPDRCGSCTRCINACPTGALTAPHQLEARRCIAYLTIEKKGTLDEELLPGVGRQVFGCDICQDVCPWNRKALVVPDAELEPRVELVNPSLAELGALSETEFEKKFNGSPVRRAGYFGLLRNVAVAMGNSGNQSFREQIQLWTGSSNEGLRSAAEWALKALCGRTIQEKQKTLF